MSVLHSIFTPHPRYRLSGGLKARGFDRPPCPGEKERERERGRETETRGCGSSDERSAGTVGSSVLTCAMAAW